MDLYEFQARELFGTYGLPVLEGLVARQEDDVAEAARRFGGEVVVKAQVKTGGRGKAGGVKLARDPDEAAARAAEILGMQIRGHTVRCLLVTPAVRIAEEYYLAILLDRGTGSFLVIASAEGGVDIELLARERPEALVRVPVDPLSGLDAALAREVVGRAGFPELVRDTVARVLVMMWDLFVSEEATLVEVNPLVRTGDGSVLALDGKVSLDDNARFRHPGHAGLVDRGDVDPLEDDARSRGLNYVKLDGEVGIIGNGAGLVMSTLDVVAHAGEHFGGVRPANFLDIGGGASAQVMADGLEIILADPQVTAVLVNVFGGITACDAVANGILHAFRLLEAWGTPVTRPIVVRLDGNNAELGQEILDAFAAGLPPGLIERVDTMDGAARRVAQLAAGVPDPVAAEGWVI